MLSNIIAAATEKRTRTRTERAWRKLTGLDALSKAVVYTPVTQPSRRRRPSHPVFHQCITARTSPSCIVYKARLCVARPPSFRSLAPLSSSFLRISLSRTPIAQPAFRSSSQSTMQSNTLFALTLLAVFAGVHAQTDTTTASDPTSTDGISDCLLACATQAGASTGCSLYVASTYCSAREAMRP